MAGVVSTVEGAKADVKAVDEVVQGGSFMTDIYKRAGAKVAGSFGEKACYYSVFLLSMGFFLLSTVNVLVTLSNDRVTTSDVTEKESIEFPIFWYCFDDSKDATKTDSQSSQENFGFDLLGAESNVNAHPAKSCPGKGDFALINVPLGTKQGIKESTTCFGPDKLDKKKDGSVCKPETVTEEDKCIGKGERKFVEALQTEMKQILQEDFSCYVVNDNKQIPAKKRTEGGPLIRKFKTAPKKGMDPNIYIGLTDPDLDFNSQNIITGKPQKLNYYNAYIDVSVTTESVTRSDQVTFLTPAKSSIGGTSRRYYHAQISSTPLTVGEIEVHSDHPDRLEEKETEVHYQFSSFLSRDVTIRRKSLAEAWAEVGGAWATALMLITFFFLPRQEAYEEWQVFRFRSVRSRKDLMRGVAAGAKEAGFVTTDYMAQDVETGPKLLEKPDWPESPKGGRK